MGGDGIKTGPAADKRGRAVCADDPAGFDVFDSRNGRGPAKLHAGALGRLHESPMQSSTPNSDAAASRKTRGNGPACAMEANAAEFVAHGFGYFHAKSGGK